MVNCSNVMASPSTISQSENDIQVETQGLVNGHNRRQWKQCQIYCIQVSLIVLQVTLWLVNLLGLVISFIFDTKCAIKQSSSIVHCTENVLFIKKAQLWVMLYEWTTIFNSFLVLTAMYMKPSGLAFCGFKEALKQLVKRASFWSFNITYIFVILDYVLTINHLKTDNKALAVSLIIFTASKLIVAYFLNYVLPVKFPAANERNILRVFTWFFYWMTLVVFFLATTQSALAVTLDVAEKVTAWGNVKRGSQDYQTVCLLVLLGFKATFQGRLFLFYWNKFFHGDKDLLSNVWLTNEQLQMAGNDNEHQT